MYLLRGCPICAQAHQHLHPGTSSCRTYLASNTPLSCCSSQVKNYSPGYMEQASSRGHEASPQSGLSVQATSCAPAAKSCAGWVDQPSWVRRADAYALFAKPGEATGPYLSFIHGVPLARHRIAPALGASFLAAGPRSEGACG